MRRWLALLMLCLVCPLVPAEEARFDVLEYLVEGNSVLSALAIERAVYPHLGERRTITDVERARQALEQAYRDAGYQTVVVEIPVQQVTDGTVLLNVLEGTVERVRVTGNRYYLAGRILEGAPSLAQGQVPFFPEVQRDLDRLNRSAGRRVTPVLRPGTVPGTTEFELRVDDRNPWHGSLELNNRFSASTERLRLLGAIRHDNFLQRGHSAGLQFQTTPENPDQVQVFLATYAVPLETMTLFAYYVDSKSNVATVGGISVLGAGRILGLRASWPIRRWSALSHQLTLGGDLKDFDENLAQPGQPALRTPISYLPFSLEWSGSVQTRESLTQMSLATVFSVRDLGNRPAEFVNRRFRATPSFFVLRGDVQHTRPVLERLTLALRMDGQLADQPLVSNEQFFAGGANSVRGYLESEALGDRGLRISGELRSPSLAAWFGEAGVVRELRAFGFYEHAWLAVNKPLAGQLDRFRLESSGLGLRARLDRGFEFLLSMGWPLRATLNTPRGEPRAQFSAAWRF